MGVYTDFFEEELYDVLKEDDYIGELKKIRGSFDHFIRHWIVFSFRAWILRSYR